MNQNLLLGLILALTATAGYLYVQNASEQHLYGEFLIWQSQTGKSYGNNFSNDSESYRYSVWADNYRFIQKFNAEQTGSLRLGTTIFADLLNEEYISLHLNGSLQETIEEGVLVEQDNKSVPTSIDWVSKGAVNPVENQGSCGSCWAFSTKETLEGLYQITSGNLEVFSAQQLTDCSTASFGCGGGYQISTYQYTASKGIQSEASYPYVSGSTGKATPCTYNAANVVFKNKGQAMVSPRNNQDAILNAIQNQPLSVLVAASGITFQLYSSGVLSSCGTRTDHAILLTGYNTSASEPSYTCKNSWGTSWGNKGYIQFAMTGNGVGTCAVQSSVAYPTA